MKQSVMGELGNKKDTGLKRGQKTRTWGEMSAWLYLAPALAILLTFQVYPIYKSFMMGFYTRFDYLTDTVYEWGLGNFRYILCDENFRIAMKNTCVLVFFAAPLSIGSGLLFALLLNSNIRFKPFFQSVYFLPFVTSMVAVSIVWSWMLNKDYGLVNGVIRFFGGKKIAWMTDRHMTMPILVALCIWKGLGYRIIIFLAALQGIDKRYYSAARVDGARTMNRFWHVTIPMLKPILIFLSITTVIGCFKTFDEVYVMYNHKPGPSRSGLTIVYYIFNKFYEHWEFSIAAAAAFFLFLLIFAVTLLQFLLSRRRKSWD